MATKQLQNTGKDSGPIEPPHETKRHKKRGWRIFRRSLAIFLVLIFSAAGLAFGAVHILFTGPSPTMRDIFVITVMETSAAKFLARMYFTDDEIAAIRSKNAIKTIPEVTDTTTEFESPAPEVAAQDPIEIVDVTGATFKGKMMIVQDPSRVDLATIAAFGKEAEGKRVETLVKDTGAIAGTNAGGFEDKNGVGNGGQPLGLVIANSAIKNGSAQSTGTVIGFDAGNRLIVGRMSGQEALDLGMRCAVSFEPALIVNSKAAEIVGSGGGLNPRTAIGQRADGAVLLLVIDGRQPHSIGASLGDLVKVMQDFGAINAANLDGGSSSMMVYDGEIINVCASLYGSRKQPAAFVVR